MKIADIGILTAIRSLLPHFVVAGRLACRIQDDITKSGNRNGEAKNGDRFTEALTDADIAIETYLATVLLTMFDDVAFYGEEYERDRVSAYFPKEAQYLVTLDPVDGTLYFKDGLPIFAVIMTICVKETIQASVIYQPREERFYAAIRGEGAWTTTAADVAAGKEPEPHRVTERGNVVIAGASFLHRKAALEAAGFEVVNPATDYDGSKDWWKTNIRLLTGEVIAMAISNAQLIDACAIAFIAAEAGGKDNAPVFNMTTKRAERLIVATSPATYERFAAALVD